MGACGGDENGSSPAPWARSTPGTPCDWSGPACCRRRPCAKREYHRWLPASVRAATRSVRTRVPPAHTNGSPPFPAIPISILHRLVESDGVVAGGADVIMPVGCGGLPRIGRWWSDLLGSGAFPQDRGGWGTRGCAPTGRARPGGARFLQGADGPEAVGRVALRRERGGPGVFGAPDTVLETGPQPDAARHSPATKAHLPWTCAGLSSPHHSGRRGALTPCSAPQQRKPEANPPGL